MKYGKRSVWVKIRSSPIFVVVLVVLVGILAKATWSMNAKNNISEERLALARQEIDKLEERRSDLSYRVSYLSTEMGIESELRTRYRAVKDGESVAVIVDRSESDGSSVSSTSSLQSNIGADIGWWSSLIQKFGF
ncbi:MAG: hypothetical protein WC648_01620 [Candidatus Paceibacterota bacterium]|jgi:cell division protein FtsB